MRNHRTYTEEQLRLAVEESFSIANVIRKLNLIVGGANYKGIDKHIKSLSLDISHFTGRGHLKGKTHFWAAKFPLETILIENSSYSNCSQLRVRLIKEGFFSYECQSCKLTEWLGKPISLELDHINGVNDDNRIDNLRILCPNCHAQTDTYRGKNKKKAKKYPESDFNRQASYPAEPFKDSVFSSFTIGALKTFCIDCNKSIYRGSSRCKSCDSIFRIGKKSKIDQTSCLAVSKQLGVSDNAIWKRLKRNNQIVK